MMPEKLRAALVNLRVDATEDVSAMRITPVQASGHFVDT